MSYIFDGDNPKDCEMYLLLIKLLPDQKVWITGKKIASRWTPREQPASSPLERNVLYCIGETPPNEPHIGVYYTYGDNPNEITGLK